jgi:hypothetical protein
MKIIIFLIVLLLASCKSFTIYHNETKGLDPVISGKNVQLFFTDSLSSFKSIKQKKYISIKIDNEINSLIEKLKTEKNLDIGIGIYYYAFIRKTDTLYSDPNFKAWKYKSFVGINEDIDLINNLQKIVGRDDNRPN